MRHRETHQPFGIDYPGNPRLTEIKISPIAESAMLQAKKEYSLIMREFGCETDYGLKHHYGMSTFSTEYTENLLMWRLSLAQNPPDQAQDEINAFFGNRQEVILDRPGLPPLNGSIVQSFNNIVNFLERNGEYSQQIRQDQSLPLEEKIMGLKYIQFALRDIVLTHNDFESQLEVSPHILNSNKILPNLLLKEGLEVSQEIGPAEAKARRLIASPTQQIDRRPAKYSSATVGLIMLASIMGISTVVLLSELHLQNLNMPTTTNHQKPPDGFKPTTHFLPAPPDATPTANDIAISNIESALAQLTDKNGSTFRQVMTNFGYKVGEIVPTKTHTAPAGKDGLRVRLAPTADDQRILSKLGIPGYIDTVNDGHPVTWESEINVWIPTADGKGWTIDCYGIIPADEQSPQRYVRLKRTHRNGRIETFVVTNN